MNAEKRSDIYLRLSVKEFVSHTPGTSTADKLPIAYISHFCIKSLPHLMLCLPALVLIHSREAFPANLEKKGVITIGKEVIFNSKGQIMKRIPPTKGKPFTRLFSDAERKIIRSKKTIRAVCRLLNQGNRVLNAGKSSE